ncbi:MAG: YitT family protein [Oscillospiraceae bacterium]
MKKFTLDTAFFVLGNLIFAISINVFTAPNDIAPGGLTGLGTMANHLFNIPIGISVLVMNLPIFLWGFFASGGKFIAKTVAATLICSFLIDFTAKFLPSYGGDKMLAAIFGGLLAGIGLSLIYIRGGTTGGTDLIATLIGRRFRQIKIGKMIFFIDLFVVGLAALVYQNFESPLYAIIAIFITSKIIDTVLYGTNRFGGKAIFIISPKNSEISKAIMNNLERGVTVLKSRGCYTNSDSEVLLCAVRRQEIYKTYDIIHAIDQNAFIIVGDAAEINGEGFE